jgi:ABC-type branched-subunit amino acid transport system ATPase component
MYRVKVNATPKHPAIDADFGRVNVLLGANGTGKTALLDTFQAGVHVQFNRKQSRRVDARRIMQVIGRSSLTRAEVTDSIESVASNLLEKFNWSKPHLDKEASKLLEALCHRDRRIALLYSDEAHELALSGKQPDLRPRGLSPLDEFRTIYKAALPELDLHFDTNAVTLAVQRHGNARYGPEHMSSGEQQAFLLLGKFIFGHPSAVFLVDEPELNLNPRLAERFWSLIERRHPECVFVYATHALHFALRPEVDRALVLTRTGVIPLDESQEFLELAREDREQFLGSIPSIVLATKVLFTEGEPDSIDRALYEYLLQDVSVKVESLGSCEEVEKAVGGKQGWEKFTKDAQVGGVIDADFKPLSEIGRLKKLNAYMLPLHEAESILCHPEAVEALAKAMHPPNQHVTAGQVVSALQTRLKARRIQIALKRAARVFQTKLAPSVSAKDADGIHSDAQALAAFQDAFAASMSFLQDKNPQQVLQDELNTIDAAIAGGSANEMLRLFPGKELTSQVKSLLGLSCTDNDMLAYYQKHFPTADLPCFAAIRTELIKLFT